jgi:tellurite resistance protein TehA-like permease
VAISALAVAELAHATRRLESGGDLFSALRIVALILWAAALVWLVLLVLAELRWPRPRYRSQRWATVFPLGMYAVCSFALDAAGGPPFSGDFARVWIWFALAGWAATAVGMLGAIARRVDFGARRSSHRRPFPIKED